VEDLRSIPARLKGLIRPVIWFLLLGSSGVLAEPPALVSAMLANAPRGAADRCGYTRESINNNESKVERFDPSRDDAPWALLSMNGRPPDAEVLESYADMAENRLDRQHPLEFDLLGRVEPDTWALVSESEDEAVFSFRLRLDPDENLDVRLLDKISSTLTLDKHSLQPKRVLIESTGAASVAPMVRITQYRQEFLFVWNDAVDAAALAEKATRRRGKAPFKSLNQDKRRVYRDYECAVYAQELPDEMPIEN
jgi:hypothetical protein